ncbi:MAG: alpha/beta hydrolase [Candidatus Saccharibacteria bacterium]
MKTALFVPGSGEGLQSRDYATVLKAIESKGYKVKFVPITWPRTTLDKWVAELMAVYDTYDAEDTILAGFSWGAMTAFVAATMRTPSELWLFSLSPYFAEDLPRLKRSWLRQNGHRRVSAFHDVSFNKLAPKIACPVKLFAGENESETIMHRLDEASKRLKEASRTYAKGAGHEIDHPGYILAIKGNI